MPARRITPGPILIYVVGVAFFCGMDAVMKHLVGQHDAIMATLWRYVAAILFILPFWWREGRPAIRREMLPANALRGVTIAVSATLFFWALGVLPLAEAVTIAFIAPLLIPPLAALILKEQLDPRSMLAGLIGFAGVLVAVGTDWGGMDRMRLMGVGATLIAALAYALTIVFTRMRAAADGPSILSLLGALFPIAFIAPAMFALVPRDEWLPSIATLPFFLLAGLTGAVALQFIARAYARVEAQVLAPFEYTALGWAALFGWIFFDESVSWRTWFGAAIIIAACLWQARRSAPVPAPSSPAA